MSVDLCPAALVASVRVPWAYVNTEMDAWIHVREEQCSGRIKRPSNRGKGHYFEVLFDCTLEKY